MNYSSVTGPTPTSKYDQSATTPLAALLVKPLDWLSLYASYAEGFGFGPIPPGNAVNNTAVFPPIVSTQIETGAKLDLGTVGLSLAFYEITQPSGFLDPVTRVFGVNGEQRNRGVDFTVFGSPIDGVLTKTQGGAFNGNVAPGVPNAQVNIGGEVDLPPWLVPGLTLAGRVIHTSAQYVDLANSQKIPEWTRFDLGARYRFEAGERFWTARFNVENVTGLNYWATATPSVLNLGMPRTYRLSLSVDL